MWKKTTSTTNFPREPFPCRGPLEDTKRRAALASATRSGEISGGFALTIADGYHRICASYWLDENADIPCRVVDLASGSASPSEAPAES